MPDLDRRPWYERDPARKQWELDAFAHYHLPANEAYENGRLVIRTALEYDGRDVPIEVTYVDEFPDAPPVVRSPENLFERHRALFLGDLCVLENPDLEWRPDRSAAELVAVNAQNLLLDSAAGPDAVARNEADYPEPESSRFPYDGGPTLLVPDPFFEMEMSPMATTIRLGRVGVDSYLLCSVGGIGDVDRQLEQRLVDGNSGGVAGVVIPMEAAPSNHFISHRILDGVPGAMELLASSPQEWFIAVTFPEEGPRRGETRRAWMLFQARRTGEEETVRLGRGLAITPSERTQRIPELADLAEGRALVVGAGSVGSAVCVELAKAGIGAIHIIDLDFYDPSNAVRHVLPIKDSGKPKAQAVAEACIALNPFIEARAHSCFIGRSEFNGAGALLPELVGLSDVVIDATASQIVTRVLQRYTRGLDTPLVVTALTAGSYGGEILVVRPRGGCFDCFVEHQRDGTIPDPPMGRRSNVVPTGCMHPAFSGAGFDATELAAATTRTALQVSGRAGYPPLGHDWVILDFRSPARSQTGNLTVHPRCSRH